MTKDGSTETDGPPPADNADVQAAAINVAPGNAPTGPPPLPGSGAHLAIGGTSGESSGRTLGGPGSVVAAIAQDDDQPAEPSDPFDADIDDDLLDDSSDQRALAGQTEALPPLRRRRSVEFRNALAGSDASDAVKLGTFAGVFRPTLLTILGVMMYLRLGWVVGEAGLLGAIAIIALIFGITIPTALSLSSITTNVRLGAGGVFQLIAQSLGLETGGAIGIPLYFAQALSAGLYLYGFTETWLHIFPGHPPWAVISSAFVVVTVTVSFTETLAFKLQGIVFIVGIVSLATIMLGMPMFDTGSIEAFHSPQWWGQFESNTFWQVFAVMFPGGTGIMVGAMMSGSLTTPRRSIPRGTLAAVGAALLVYLSLAVWYGVMATPVELRANTMIVVERAAWGPMVLAGILASTFTAALNTMVTAPRVLQSLAAHHVLPRSGLFKDSLRNASLVTAVLVALVLMLGSLNRVAVIITMFFLLTYLIINVVVLIEQFLGMVSFRPTFKVPLAVPVFGALGSALAIFIVSPAFALLAIGMVVGIYVWLINRKLDTPWETVRSSIFVSVVDWATRRIDTGDDEHNERSWKPDLLVPVTTRTELDGSFRFLRSITVPKGSLQVVGVQEADGANTVHLSALREVVSEFRRSGLHATATVLQSANFVHGVRQCCAVLAGSQSRPNVLYTQADQHGEDDLQGLVDLSVEYKLGALILMKHPQAGFGHERTINVWVRDQSPEWYLGLRLASLDLSILCAYLIGQNWKATIRLITVITDPEEADNAASYLDQLIEDARLIKSTETLVLTGDFTDCVERAPRADLNIMGMSPTVNVAFFERLSEQMGGSILFVRDSGRESALA